MVDRILARLQPLLQRGELRFALGAAAGRLQRGRDGADIVHILSYLRENFCDLAQPAVDAIR